MYADSFSVITGFSAGLTLAIILRSNVSKLWAVQCAKKTEINDIKLAVVLRTDLSMQLGKSIAQACHAGVGCYSDGLNRDSKLIEQWEEMNSPVIIAKLPSGGETALYEIAKRAKKLGICAKVIHDAGRTQIAHGTATAVGIGPADSTVINQICGHLECF